MALLDYIETSSVIHRVDPRARLVVCAAMLAALASVERVRPLIGALALALLLIAMLRLPLRALGRRFLALNVFLGAWWVTAPWFDPIDGPRIAAAATLKANAMLLFISLLVSTIDIATLGHALAHLRVPAKLVHLLLFTARYTETLWAEQQRMQRALRARAFRPRADAHTCRSLASLIGLLLVRSLDRSARMLAAMRCRGYCGQFYLLRHFHYHARDAWFMAAGLATAALLAMGARL